MIYNNIIIETQYSKSEEKNKIKLTKLQNISMINDYQHNDFYRLQDLQSVEIMQVAIGSTLYQDKRCIGGHIFYLQTTVKKVR